MRETEAQKRERHHQEDLQRLRGFRPIDDTFMRGMFKDNIPLAELTGMISCPVWVSSIVRALNLDIIFLARAVGGICIQTN